MIRERKMSKTFFNSSPNDLKRTYEVARHDILKDLFNLYCAHYPGNELKNIAFIGEMAIGDGVQIIAITTTNKYQYLNGDLQKQLKKFPCTLNVFKRHDCAGEF